MKDKVTVKSTFQFQGHGSSKNFGNWFGCHIQVSSYWVPSMRNLTDEGVGEITVNEICTGQAKR